MTCDLRTEEREWILLREQKPKKKKQKKIAIERI